MIIWLLSAMLSQTFTISTPRYDRGELCRVHNGHVIRGIAYQKASCYAYKHKLFKRADNAEVFLCWILDPCYKLWPDVPPYRKEPTE